MSIDHKQTKFASPRTQNNLKSEPSKLNNSIQSSS